MPWSSSVCLTNARCLLLSLFKKKLGAARQNSKPLVSCKGNNFGISALLSKRVIIKVPIEKWVWMFQNQFIFLPSHPLKKMHDLPSKRGRGWGGVFTKACEPACITYPVRIKFSGRLSLVKEISTVGCVCDFFLMRKAIAPYKICVLWTVSQVLLGPKDIHFGVGVLHVACQNVHSNPC